MESTGRMCDARFSGKHVLLSSDEILASHMRRIESSHRVQCAQDFPLIGTVLYSCGYCGWGLARPTNLSTISRLLTKSIFKDTNGWEARPAQFMCEDKLFICFGGVEMD